MARNPRREISYIAHKSETGWGESALGFVFLVLLHIYHIVISSSPKIKTSTILSITQIQMHKYTNTSKEKHKCTNTAYDKITEIPNICYILNSWWFKDVKNDNPKCSNPRNTVDVCRVPPGLYSWRNECILYWFKIKETDMYNILHCCVWCV